MSDILSRLKKNLEESFDLAKSNAQNFKEIAGEYSKTARLKIELAQLNSTMKKKTILLGETVYPFLLEQNFEGLKKHETLRVIIDEIKQVQNEIDLNQKQVEMVSEKPEPRPEFDSSQVRDQIKDLEDQIESRIQELKTVKDALDKEEQKPEN